MDVGVLVNAFYDIFREMTVGFHDSIGCGSFGFTEERMKAMLMLRSLKHLVM